MRGKSKKKIGAWGWIAYHSPHTKIHIKGLELL